MNIEFNPELIGQGLEIMLFGMAGIFLVAIILYLASLALIKIFPNNKDTK
jgi:Na+-transporting methylmalonyl-CoA/oxaloacetate decarboxylase gamma subunit